MKVLYRSRLLLPDSNSQIVKDAAVLVEDGVIKGVSSYDGPWREWRPEEIINLGNSIMMPSFSNIHTHVAMVMLRGVAEGKPLSLWLRDIWAIEAKLSAEELKAGDVVGLYELVNAGITSFIDFYDVKPMLDALLSFRIKATIGLPFLETSSAMSEESWHRLKMVKQYDNMITAAGAKMALAPHSTYSCSEGLLRELAKFDSYRIEIHVSETYDDVKKLKENTGFTPFEYLKEVGLLNNRLIAAHGVHTTSDEIGLIRDSGATIAHCPRSNARLGSGIAPINNLLKTGVRVGLGTDGPASGENFDMFEEMRSGVYLSRASSQDSSSLGVRDALQMGTEAGHRALGLESGRLEGGRPADFITVGLERLPQTWDILSSIVYAGSVSAIKDVYVDGIPAKKEYVVQVSDQKTLRDSFEQVAAIINENGGS